MGFWRGQRGESEVAGAALSSIVWMLVAVVVAAALFFIVKSIAEARTGIGNAQAASGLRERMIDECTTAWSCRVPPLDALGRDNSDGHAVAFFTRTTCQCGPKGLGEDLFWEYDYTAATSTVTEYKWQWDGAAFTAPVAQPGTWTNITSWTFANVLASQRIDSSSPYYNPLIAAIPGISDVSCSYGFTDFPGWNGTVQFSISAGKNGRDGRYFGALGQPRIYCKGARTYVVGYFTPTPAPTPTGGGGGGGGGTPTPGPTGTPDPNRPCLDGSVANGFCVSPPPGYDLYGAMSVDMERYALGSCDITGCNYSEQDSAIGYSCDNCGAAFNLPQAGPPVSPWRAGCFGGCAVSLANSGGGCGGNSGCETGGPTPAWYPVMQFTTSSGHVRLNLGAELATARVTSPADAYYAPITTYRDPIQSMTLPDGSDCQSQNSTGCWAGWDRSGESFGSEYATPGIKIADASGNAVSVTTTYNCTYALNPGGGGSPYNYWDCVSDDSYLPGPGTYYLWVNQGSGQSGGNFQSLPTTGSIAIYWAPFSVYELTAASTPTQGPNPTPAPTATPFCTPFQHSRGFC